MTPPTKPTGSASATVKVDTSAPAPATDKKQPHKLTLGLDANFLWQFNGYKDSYIFNDRYGKIGDYTDKNLGAFLLFNLLPLSNFKLWMGPRLQVDSTDGNQNTSGSSFQSYTGGLQVEPDWGHWTTLANGHLQLFPSLGLYTTAGYGRGTGQAETISLHKQEGFAWNVGAKLPVARFKVGDYALSVGPSAQTQVIDGKVFNTATTGVGFFLDARADVTPREPEKVVVTAPPPPPQCDPLGDEIKLLVAEINGSSDKPGLKAKLADMEKKVAAKREGLKVRPIDPLNDEEVLKVLRTQRASELAQEELLKSGLDPKKPEDYKKMEKIIEKYMPEAEKRFPSAEAFWTPKTAMIDDKTLQVPDPLPTSCDDLSKILKILKKSRDDLNSRLNELTKIDETPFPPRIRETITTIIGTVEPNLKKIHFENDRPNDYDLTAFRKAITASQTKNDGKVDWNDPTLRKVLNGIFGTGYVNEVVKTVEDTKKALNENLIKDINQIEVQGHTSLAGDAKHNQKLSERRAIIITEMLEAPTKDNDGVKKGRLVPKGYGETQPIRPDEESLPAKSAERAAAAGDNRRIELKVPDSEISRLEGMGTYVPEVVGGKKKPPPPAPAKADDSKPAAPGQPPAPAKPAAPAKKPAPKGDSGIDGLP